MDFLEPKCLELLGQLAAVEDISLLLRMSLHSTKDLVVGQTGIPDRKGWSSSTYTTRYCALCLKQDEIPHLRGLWRFHFVPVCRVHKTVLQTGCWNNSCRYSLPLSKFSPDVKCPKCHNILTDACTLKPQNCEKLFWLMDSIIGILESDYLPPGFGFRNSAREFFNVLLFLVRYFKLFLPRSAQWESLFQEAGLSMATPFDWRKNNSGACILIEKALDLMTDWPSKFLLFASENKARLNIVAREYENEIPKILLNILAPTSRQFEYQSKLAQKRGNGRMLDPCRDRITIVRDAVESLIQSGRMPYLKTISKFTGISPRALAQDNRLYNTIAKGQQLYRDSEVGKMKEAICRLKARRMPVNETSVAAFLGKSFHYVRKSRLQMYKQILDNLGSHQE